MAEETQGRFSFSREFNERPLRLNAENNLIDATPFRGIESVLNIFRLLGFLPFVQEDGLLVTCLSSTSKLTLRKLLVCFYSFLCYGVYCFIFTTRLQNLSSSGINAGYLRIAIILSSLSFFLVPVKFWLVTSHVCSYFNQWVCFGGFYESVTGCPLVFPSSSPKIIASLIGSSILAGYYWFHSTLPLVFKLAMALIIFGCIMNSLLWFIMCDHLSLSADQLMRAYEDVVRGRSSRRTYLKEYPRLWLTLREILHDTGNVLTFNYVLDLVVNVYFHVFLIFELLEQDFSDVFSVVAIVLQMLSLSCLYVNIISANNATGEVNASVLEKLMAVLSEERNEYVLIQMNRFVSTVVEDQTNINLGGFITLNKELLTTLFGLIVTNVVILLQFQQVNKSS